MSQTLRRIRTPRSTTHRLAGDTATTKAPTAMPEPTTSRDTPIILRTTGPEAAIPQPTKPHPDTSMSPRVTPALTTPAAAPRTAPVAEARAGDDDRTPAPHPLASRVDPFGRLFAGTARGLYMGNRGGRIHDRETQQISRRRWVSDRWICCKLTFGSRQRDVWSDGYTELFFLDEVTALAAGHRPCFECRRKDAEAFAAAWAQGNGYPAVRPVTAPSAAAIDKVLHAERIDPGEPPAVSKRLHVAFVDTLPDGAMIAGEAFSRDRSGAATYAVRGRVLLPWSPQGWGPPLARPHSLLVTLITPPSIVATLMAGYRPVWHPSAGQPC